jgi:hypothetical protein
MQVYAAEQNYFLQYGRYVVHIDDVPKSPSEGGLGLGLTSEFGEFRLSVDATDSGYVATVWRLQPDASDRCARFSIDEAGMRHAFDAAGAEHGTECLG